MEKSKKQLIKDLIDQAQNNIWTNELAKDFAEQSTEFKTEAEKEVKIKACDHAIERDTQYINFLKGKLPKEYVSGTPYEAEI